MSNVIDFKARVSTSYKLNPVKDETVQETDKSVIEALNKVQQSVSKINSLMHDLKALSTRSFSEEEKLNKERETRLAKERAMANEKLKRDWKLIKR